MNLPEFSVNRRVTVLMLALIVVLFGILSLFELGLDMLPELEYPFISVVTTYAGVAPQEIEDLLSRPIEEAAGTVKGVKRVLSESREGISVVMIEFEWGTNLDFAAQDVRDKISLLSDLMPDDADAPLVVKFNTTDMPVFFYVMTGMGDTSELRKYVSDNIKPRLERLEGVASAFIMGGLEREINVFIERDKLRAYTLSIEQVIATLRAENLNETGGHIVEGHKEYLLRTIGEYQNVDTIRQTIIANSQGTPIYLKDIARVEDSFKEARNTSRVNGQNCILLAIMKESGANTVQVIRRVKRAVDQFRAVIPEDIRFYTVMDQGEFIEKIISRTTLNALQGGLLTILMIFMFLRNWRPTFTIGIAIPLSIIPTFIGLRALSYTFNLMTMGGLALGIGMLVDNAVVVIENTFRHLEEGKDKKEAARLGGSEVQMAITSSTLTTVAVFLPMVLSSGLSGKLARPLALTVVVALFSSLFVALTLVPMLSTLILKRQTADPSDSPPGRGRGGLTDSEESEASEPTPAPSQEGSSGSKAERKSGKGKQDVPKNRKEGRFIRFRDRYRHLLLWALTHRKTVLGAGALSFSVSLLIIVFVIGAEFMPSQDIPMIFAMVYMPVGTSLEETDRVIRQLEEIAMDQPEVLHVSAFTGLSESTKFDVGGGRGAAGVNESQIMMRLTEKDERERSTNNIIEAIRRRLPKIRGAKFEFVDMGQAMQGGWGDQTPVALKLYGKDIDSLGELAAQVIAKIESVDGLRDVDMSLKEGKPEFQIDIDREKASQLGLSISQIANTVKTAMLGTVAGKYRLRGEEFDIRVRFHGLERDSIQDVRNITIPSPSGFSIPLYQVADIHEAEGPLKITRENQSRKVTVTANIFERDIKSIIADVKAQLEDLDFPSGYFFEYGGTYKDMNEAFVTLTQALVVAILLVYMVMAAQFESFLQPFIIMFTIPLALVGVIVGLALFNYPLSVPVFMGIIILTGIVVNNAIVMIDYINHLRWHKIEAHHAIIEGAAVRLRPILITTLTTCLGMLPMALSRAEGSEMRSPMAVAISFGLLFAMVLTLFVIPVVYSIMSRISFKGLSKEDLREIETDHQGVPVVVGGKG